MSRVGKPAAVVLAVPVLVSLLGLLGRANWEARWDPVLARQAAAARALPYGGLLLRPSLSTICSDSRIGPRFPPCGTYALFSSVVWWSALAGGAGIAFLGALRAGGRYCRSSRERMTKWLRPALTAAAIGTAGLGMAHGLLAVAAVVTAAGAIWLEPVQRFPGPALLAAGAVGVGWALAMGSVAFGLIRRPDVPVVGERLDLQEQRALADLVGEAAGGVGADPPGHLVACLAPWLFVTEMPVTSLSGRVSGRTLCLSLPLLRILSVDECRALLAHEMAHYSREQAGYTSGVVATLAHARRVMSDMTAGSRGLRAVVSGPPLALLRVLVDEVSAGAPFDDDRELAADRAAAALAGGEPLAAGLVKLAAFAPAWDAALAMMRHAAFSGAQYLNAAEMFQQIAASNAGPDRLAGVAALSLGHPIDRHPPIERRLAALGLAVEDVAADALRVVPDRPAASLVADGEQIERRLSAAEHQTLLETGGR
jgi:Zn-dependent protease with chaperone function